MDVEITLKKKKRKNETVRLDKEPKDNYRQLTRDLLNRSTQKKLRKKIMGKKQYHTDNHQDKVGVSILTEKM